MGSLKYILIALVLTPTFANAATVIGQPKFTLFSTGVIARFANQSTALANKIPYTGATGNVNLGAHDMSTQSISITGTGGAGFITLPAQSPNPPSPAAGILLIHSSTANGYTRMEQDNEATTNLIYGRDSVFIAKNTSGSTINAGQVVYKTGSTGNVPNIALAKADSTTTLPAIGIALDTIGNNNFGQIMSWGIKGSFDTSALGTSSVWVSATTAGALTSTRPSYPNFPQRIGSVLVNGVGNGSLLVTTAPHIGGMDSGTNAASFTAAAFVGPLTGNASTATKWAAGRTIGITGPITWTSPSVDGSGNVTAAATVTSQTGTGSTFVMDTAPTLKGNFQWWRNAGSFAASDAAMSLGNGGASANYFKAATHYWQDNTGATIGTLSGSGLSVNGGSTNHTTCWKAGGTLGYCSSAVASDGTCTCN